MIYLHLSQKIFYLNLIRYLSGFESKHLNFIPFSEVLTNFIHILDLYLLKILNLIWSQMI